MDDASREKAVQLLGLAQGGVPKIPVWLDCDTGSFTHSNSDLTVSILSPVSFSHDDQMLDVRYRLIDQG